MWYFIIALLAGIAATYYGFKEHTRVGEIETDGKEVVGEIWLGEERSGRNRRLHRLAISQPKIVKNWIVNGTFVIPTFRSN